MVLVDLYRERGISGLGAEQWDITSMSTYSCVERPCPTNRGWWGIPISFAMWPIYHPVILGVEWTVRKKRLTVACDLLVWDLSYHMINLGKCFCQSWLMVTVGTLSCPSLPRHGILHYPYCWRFYLKKMQHHGDWKRPWGRNFGLISVRK